LPPITKSGILIVIHAMKLQKQNGYLLGGNLMEMKKVPDIGIKKRVFFA